MMDSEHSSNSSRHRVTAQELSYTEMTTDASGSVLSKSAKEDLRRQHGYCLTCPMIPILLYDIRRSRLTLRTTRKPRTVPGECVDGKCVKCNPESDPSSNSRRVRGMLTKTPSFMNTSSASLASVSSFSSAHSADSNDSGSHHPRPKTPTKRGGRRGGEAGDSSTGPPPPPSQQQLHHRSDHHAQQPRRGRGAAGRGCSGRIPPRHTRSVMVGRSTPSSRNLVAAAVAAAPPPAASSSANHHHHRPGLVRTPPSRSLSSPPTPQEQAAASAPGERSASPSGATHGTATRKAPPCRDSPSSSSRDLTLSSSQEITVQHPTRPQKYSARDEAVAGRFKRLNSGSCFGIQRGVGSRDDGARSLANTSTSTVASSSAAASGLGPETSAGDARGGDDGLVRDAETLLEGVKATGCGDVLSEWLVTTMEAHAASEPVQAICLRTVAEVFENHQPFDSTVFVGEHYGYVRVLDALRNFPSSLSVQEQGCKALAVLASREENRDSLILSGACAMLIKAVTRHLGDASSVKASFGAVRVLSSTEPAARDLFVDSGMSKVTVEAMQCNASDKEIQQDGCAILSNMAVDAEQKSVSIVSKSVVVAVLQALQNHSRDEQVVESACFALKNFSYNENNVRVMASTDGLMESLQKAAATHDSVLVSADFVLEQLYISRAQDESLEDQAHQSLQATVNEKSDDPQVIQDVVDTLKSYTWSARLLTECFQTLKSMAQTSPSHKSVLLETVSLDQLLEYAGDLRFNKDVKDALSLLAALYRDTDESVLNVTTTACSVTPAA